VVLINGLDGPAYRLCQAGQEPEAQPKSPCGMHLSQNFVYMKPRRVISGGTELLFPAPFPILSHLLPLECRLMPVSINKLLTYVIHFLVLAVLAQSWCYAPSRL
jgi:hypothetical protein